MDWAKIITTVLTNTVFLAILGFVAKSVFEHLLSKDIDKFKARLQAAYDRELEKFRADLRLAAFEHETRFAKLHEERAKVIAELYKKLLRTQRSLRSLAYALQSKELGQDKDQAVTESIQAFWDYFEEHRIYFSERVCCTIDEFYRHAQLAYISLSQAELERLMSSDDNEDYRSRIEEATKELADRISPIRQDIERVFRELLGIDKHDTEDT